jgi:phage terminase large subunit-like protein
LTPVSPEDVTRGDGGLVCEFVDEFGRITKDGIAGKAEERLVLRSWQRDLVGHLLARRADGRLRHRSALIGMARKNGKSALASELGKAQLFLGPAGGEVYSCAADKEQARITFSDAKRGIEMVPELREAVKLYKDVIEVLATGSIWRVLSAEAFTKEGLNPHAVIFDEVHAQPNRELWDVMELAMGNRHDPLMLGITTAGVRTDNLGRDSLCYGMYQYGQRVVSGEVDDPSFFFAWWEPVLAEKADHTDPAVWAEGNPGLGDTVDVEDFHAKLGRTPESEFRTKRTNIFVVGKDAALPHGAWAARLDADRVVGTDEPVVLGFDGSWSGDSTALVAVTLEAPHHVSVVDVWERPEDANDWRVPVADVEARIVAACRERNVRGVVIDPAGWRPTFDRLEDEGLPVVEMPNSVQRMVPAWKTFYDGVLDGLVTHDGDPRLARHVENMVLKIDARGARPTKDAKSSRRHIDLGIAAVMAVEEARRWAEPEAASAPFVWVLGG